MPPAATATMTTSAPSTNPNRRQPTRQVRTSIARPTNYYARQYTSHQHDTNSFAADTPPGFFPAITHFTDAISALPKEVMGQFSMLKEVEAKVHGPNEELRQIMEDIKRLPPARASYEPPDISRGGTAEVASANGSVHNGATPVHYTAQLGAPAMPPGIDQLEFKRRELSYRLCFTIHNMNPTLDEKIAVLSTANQTLAMQLERMMSSFKFIPEELSEEARLGSTAHWAYVDKEANKKTSGNERSRRDVQNANNIAAAAAAIQEADLAASRSEARREAMMANKRNRNQHIDSDFDDRPVAKKIAAKAKKPAENAADKSVGLGITGTSQPHKRRKTEKALQAAAPAMERTLSEQRAQVGRGNPVGSPRDTPGVEPTRKKARAPAPAPIKKRAAAVAATSPPPASSPLIGTSKESQRPQNRARQNSTTNPVQQLTIESRGRPTSASSASNRPTIAQESEPSFPSRPIPFAAQSTLEPDEPPQPQVPAPQATSIRPESRSGLFKREGTEVVEEPPAPPIVTRAGRVSKTATPTVANFPEIIPMGRSRSTRNANSGNGSGASSETAVGTGTKRGSKKAPVIDEQDNSSVIGDGEDEDGLVDDEDLEEGEERYCYCEMPSFGEMIGCENDDCPRGWFHLKCLGMSEAPEGDWYCDECAKALGKSKEKGRGRN